LTRERAAQPSNKCQTQDDLKRTRDDEFFNPMEKLYKKGIGTLAYKDQWNLFDQIFIKKPLLASD